MTWPLTLSASPRASTSSKPYRFPALSGIYCFESFAKFYRQKYRKNTTPTKLRRILKKLLNGVVSRKALLRNVGVFLELVGLCFCIKSESLPR